MSPILYSIFCEDLESRLKENGDAGVLLDELSIILLSFADDMVIISKSPEELQQNISKLHKYCTDWGLSVNCEKTKVMVFRKRGNIRQNEKWNYNGLNLEVVNEFNYLGTLLKYTGNFNINQQCLSNKGLKALNVLLNNCSKFNLKPKILCQLFDAFVGSILNYSSEIWGYTKSKEIERIHLKFCKRILNVKPSTSSIGVYGELGRYPLYVNRYYRILKYWFKLKSTDNTILKVIYKEFKDCNNGQTNWISNVKSLLCDHGFAEVWNNPDSVNSDIFLPVFKQRVIDTYTQLWVNAKENSSSLFIYNNYKSCLTYEPYLDLIPYNLRHYITKIRIGSHSLRIITGRYANNNIPREQRYCSLCNSRDIEDEFHFIVICPRLHEIRKKYIKKYYYKHPNMLKFLELMTKTQSTHLRRLSLFIKEALTYRKQLIHSS